MTLKMSIKEADRLGVMRQLDAKTISLRRGSEILGISLRQVKRIRKQYLLQGEEGLISRKRRISELFEIAPFTIWETTLTLC